MSKQDGFHIKGLKVKNSAIHGKGLFTKKALSAGEQIGLCESKPARADNGYTLTMPDDSLMEVTCKLKYINHSQEPNVIYYDDLTVYTLRDIDAGEELTHHYGDDWR